MAQHKVKIAVFGGKPDSEMEYRGEYYTSIYFGCFSSLTGNLGTAPDVKTLMHIDMKLPLLPLHGSYGGKSSHGVARPRH